MKKISSVLFTLLFVFALPVFVMAHPGHNHDGGFFQVLSHYITTYYIFFLPVVALLVYLMVRYFNKTKVKEEKERA